MSKVLLVNPSYNFPVKREMYPSGALLLLGTMAKQLGHDVEIIHIVTDRVIDPSELLVWKPDVVGLTVNTFQVASAKALTKMFKKSGARVVIGGAHSSSVGVEEARREFPYADDVVIGEGEFQFLSILEGKEIPKPSDLEYVVPPDLSLVDLSRFTGAYPTGRRPTTFVMASRGCPSRCTFCNRSVFGNKVRYRSPENVLRELRYYADYGIKEVFIQDDTFNLRRDWYEEILHGIIAYGLNKRMQFRAPFRADEKLVDLKMLKLAKRAGFWLLFYGVESGSQAMLNRIQKRLTLEEIERAVRLTKEAGIKVETSFIVGLPGETRESVADTLRFYRKLSPFWSGCGIAIPFPNTDLYREVRGELDGLSYSDFRPGMTYFRTEALSKWEIADCAALLEKAMLRDKLRNMVFAPDVLLRTAGVELS